MFRTPNKLRDRIVWNWLLHIGWSKDWIKRAEADLLYAKEDLYEMAETRRIAAQDFENVSEIVAFVLDSIGEAVGDEARRAFIAEMESE